MEIFCRYFSEIAARRRPSRAPRARLNPPPRGATLSVHERPSRSRAAPSRKGAIKIVATVLGIGGAVALLLTASIASGAEYYKHVDEVMANADAWRGKKLRSTATSSTARSSRRRERCCIGSRSRAARRARRRSIMRHLHGPGPRHVQERRRGGRQGHADRRQPARRRPRRHHGQVPVEVRRRRARQQDREADGHAASARTLAQQSVSVAELQRVRATCSAGRRRREAAGAQRRIQRRQPSRSRASPPRRRQLLAAGSAPAARRSGRPSGSSG